MINTNHLHSPKNSNDRELKEAPKLEMVLTNQSQCQNTSFLWVDTQFLIGFY